ncbi:hypothetical protein ACW4FP_01240 [Paenarthrobacter ureafaciens]|jgi:hypothetical protein|uniref:hypothetical protein n=1 Tax=Paenarthrobacter sp. PAE-2 TaxID=2982532 RepID=UPI002230B3AD|nr:hypothetical protein [Paenarthrobacter sp. PAE-2]MCW3767381.1 hypothetical protein [Paenarthrobacter sp. PAE-2]
MSLAASLALVPAAAQAGYAPGDRGVYTVSGITYWNQANTNVTTSAATGETRSGPDTYCVSPGSIAIRGKVFESSSTGTAAALRAESVVWYTNATLCPGEYNGYSAYYYFGGGFRYFYSGGDSWAWNSGGYYNWYNTIPGKVQNP